MEARDKAKFGIALNAMAAVFGKDMSGPALQGYWTVLESLPLELVERAIGRAMAECRFMPVPAELLDLSGAGGMAMQDRAVSAWSVVVRAVQERGYYDTVVFDDPLTNATLRHLWHNWMGVDDAFEKDEEKWLRKEFERVYCSLARTGVNDEASLPLLGFFEKSNTEIGYGRQDAILMIPCGLPHLPTGITGPRWGSQVPRITMDVRSLIETIGKGANDD